jgi:hypothetical protein
LREKRFDRWIAVDWQNVSRHSGAALCEHGDVPCREAGRNTDTECFYQPAA